SQREEPAGRARPSRRALPNVVEVEPLVPVGADVSLEGCDGGVERVTLRSTRDGKRRLDVEAVASVRLEYAEGRDDGRARGGGDPERPERERRGGAEERDGGIAPPADSAVELERDDVPASEGGHQLDADDRTGQADEPHAWMTASREQRADGGIRLRRHDHVDRPTQGGQQPSRQLPVP